MGLRIDREKITHFAQTKIPPWPRVTDRNVSRIPKDELIKSLKKSTQFAVEEGSVSEEVRDRFVQRHVRGYRVDGMRVLLVDHEFDRPFEGVKLTELHPAAKALMTSKSTYAVGMEYFLPEIRRNISRIPYIGPWALRKEEQRPRLTFSKELVEVAAKAPKAVFVVDPANRESVWLTHHLLPWAVALGLLAALPVFPEVVKNPAVLLPAIAYLTMYSDIRKIGRDHRSLHPLFQRFGISEDDGRRIFIAPGIKKVVQKVKATDPQAVADKDLVLVYPKAHTMRIGDYLEHPHYVKQLLYRLRLDVPKKMRIFIPDSRLKGVNDKNVFDGWRRLFNEQLPLFS